MNHAVGKQRTHYESDSNHVHHQVHDTEQRSKQGGLPFKNLRARDEIISRQQTDNHIYPILSKDNAIY